MPTETAVNPRNRLVPHLRIQGDPLEGLFESTVDQRYRLGTLYEDMDGNTYRYALAGGTITAGLLIESAALGGADTTAQEDLTVATAGAVGDTFAYATILTTAQGDSRFIDGYYVHLLTGHHYKIKSHGSLTVASQRFELYEPLRAAVAAAANTVRLLANPYRAVTVAAVTTPVGGIVGVSRIAVASGRYFWLQTGGIATVLSAGAMTVGTSVVRAVAVAGAAGPQVAGASSVITEVVGTSICAIDDTDYGPIMLTIRK